MWSLLLSALLLHAQPVRAAECVVVSPGESIQAAIDSAGNGGCVELQSGEYFDQVVISGKNDLRLKVAVGADVSWHGYIPALAEENNDAWGEKKRSFSVTHQVFNSEGAQTGTKDVTIDEYCYDYDFNPNNRSEGHFEIVRNVIGTADDSLWFTYASKQRFEENHVEAHDGLGGYFEANRVCLGIPESVNVNPNQVGLKISRTTPAIQIVNSQNIVIDGSGGSLQLDYGGQLGSLYIVNSEVVTVNTIWVVNSFFGVAARGNQALTVSNSQFVRQFDPEWAWRDVKSYGNSLGVNAMENSAINLDKSGSDHRIFGNVIDGYFDGMNMRPEATSNEQVTKIYDNQIRNIYDDGIQFDMTTNAVIWFYDNQITDTFNGISGAPHQKDETYVLKNLVVSDKHMRFTSGYEKRGIRGSTYNADYYRHGAPLKIRGNNSAIGQAYSQNMKFGFNTFVAHGDSSTSKALITGGAEVEKGDVRNFEFYNNVFYAKDAGLVRRTGSVNDGNMYGCNLFWSGGFDNGSYREWNNSSGSVGRLSQVIGGGLMPETWVGNVETDPGFVNMETYQLVEESPGRVVNGMSLCELPEGWPLRDVLNQGGAVGYHGTHEVDPAEITYKSLLFEWPGILDWIDYSTSYAL